MCCEEPRTIRSEVCGKVSRDAGRPTEVPGETPGEDFDELPRIRRVHIRRKVVEKFCTTRDSKKCSGLIARDRSHQYVRAMDFVVMWKVQTSACRRGLLTCWRGETGGVKIQHSVAEAMEITEKHTHTETGGASSKWCRSRRPRGPLATDVMGSEEERKIEDEEE